LKIKKHIPEEGYPIISKYYPECHKEANKKELKKYGLKKFRQVNALYMHNLGELLGTNTISGKTYVSSIVPEKHRIQVDYHEKVEFECLSKKYARKINNNR
jgi:hypothetical protein